MKRFFWVLDAVVVLSFVLIGRDSHGFATEWEETLRVAAPFVIGLAVAIVSARAWRAPLQIATGAVVGSITLVVGLVLRGVVWDDGLALPFVIVTWAWIVGLMILWRAVAWGIKRFDWRRARTRGVGGGRA